jgi:hypothetical protein
LSGVWVLVWFECSIPTCAIAMRRRFCGRSLGQSVVGLLMDVTDLHPLEDVMVVVRCAADPGVSEGMRNEGQCGNAKRELHDEYL